MWYLSMEFWFALCVAALAVSEVLAYIPGIESNSVFQLVVNSIKKIKEFLGGLNK